MTTVHNQTIDGLDIVTIASDKPWRQNCYVVADRVAGDLVVVDPGVDSPELRDAIRQLDLRPALVLLTHGHPDHSGGAATLCEDFSVECAIHRDDERVLRQASTYALAFGRRPVAMPGQIRLLDADSDVALGPRPVQVVPLPGHTPGSVAFIIGSLALTGDTLFRERIGRVDLPLSQPDSIGESVQRLLDGLDGATTLFAGHGRPWTVDEARRWVASQ